MSKIAPDQTPLNAGCTLSPDPQVHGELSGHRQAQALVAEYRNGSTSWLQRTMCITYNEALKLMQELEEKGVVGPLDALGARKVL